MTQDNAPTIDPEVIKYLEARFKPVAYKSVPVDVDRVAFEAGALAVVEHLKMLLGVQEYNALIR